jgi:glycosyltransferase involved in cell wall biosynthesis
VTADLHIVAPLPYPDRPSNGMSRFTHQLANACAAGGLRVSVVGQADAAPALDGAKYGVSPCWRRGFTFALEILRELRASRARNVNIHHEATLYGPMATSILFPLLVLLCRASGMRVVTTLHHALSAQMIREAHGRGEGDTPRTMLFELASYAFNIICATVSDKVVVQHSRSIDAFPKALQSKVVYIPLIVEAATPPSPESVERVRERYSLPADYTLCFGFVSYYKGHHVLLDALERVKTPQRIVIVGPQNLRLREHASYQRYHREMRERAQSLGVHWCDYVPEEDVAAIFAGARYAVFPYVTSFAASGPLAIAASLGVPCLPSTRIDCAGFESVSFEPQADALARSLDRLNEANGALEELRACSMLYSARCSPRAVVRELLACFDIKPSFVEREPARTAERIQEEIA